MTSVMEEELRVTFFPPLYLQRRIWLLNILRREDVTSVLDIGCGEGELLACLVQPAPWLRPPLESISSRPRPSKPIDLEQAEIANLYCTHIQGLDISEPDLQYALESTAPPSSLSDRGHLRWQPAEVKIWHGGLEYMNPEFVDVECIVSMEVIEHLPEDILPFYAPMILGVYHPRLFLVTTPSYNFNALFTAPHINDRVGYPDPTGRTNRIFRHHDHKFEWTVDEFREWCEAAAQEWGYNVVIGAVGKALEPDPWGRDEECGGASQVAEFTRIDKSEYVEMRAFKSAKLKTEEGHKLLATHHHPAHPMSQRPAPLAEIGEAVKLKMEEIGETPMRFEELWFEQEIAVLCGGWMELLQDAIEEHEKLALQKMNSEKREDWEVDVVGGVQRKKDLWPNVDAADWRYLSDGSHSEEDSGDDERVDLNGDGGVHDDQNAGIETIASSGWGTSWDTSVDTSGWGKSTLWDIPEEEVQTGWEGDEGWSI